MSKDLTDFANEFLKQIAKSTGLPKYLLEMPFDSEPNAFGFYNIQRLKERALARSYAAFRRHVIPDFACSEITKLGARHAESVMALWTLLFDYPEWLTIKET